MQEFQISKQNTAKYDNERSESDEEPMNDYYERNYVTSNNLPVNPRYRTSMQTLTFGDNYINDLRNSFDSSQAIDNNNNERMLKTICNNDDSFNQVNIPKKSISFL